MQAVCLQLAGAATPNPPLFEPFKLASKHVSVSESDHAGILFSNGGKPPPIRAFLSRASSLQSSLFETHHASIVFATWGGCAPPNLSQFL